ncbi:MAG: Dabb family protein [Pirellulales bacterium]
MKTNSKRRWSLGMLCLISAGAAWTVAGVSYTPTGPRTALADAAEGKEPMLAHNVYFSLKESTPENRRKLVEACHEYLSDHPGTEFYAAGTVSDLDREVNDVDFDVGLHLVFRDRKAHDDYQVSERHVRFVEQSRSLWSKVRVFDSDVSRP